MRINYSSKKVRTPFGKPRSRRSFSISFGNGRSRKTRFGKSRGNGLLSRFSSCKNRSRWTIFKK
ncbi:MAG: hypothetical protein GX028_12120 [Clostridiaceae bacterium]|nr:hypothetical protein [Clostridiaceae bacterium]